MVGLSTSGVSHEVTVATRVLFLVMVRAGTDDGHVVSHEGFAVAVAADVGVPDGTDSLDPDLGASDVGPVTVARPEHGIVGLAVTQAQRADTDRRTWAPPAIPQPDMTQPRAAFWITADELQAQASSPCPHFAADSAADSMHGLAQPGTASALFWHGEPALQNAPPDGASVGVGDLGGSLGDNVGGSVGGNNDDDEDEFQAGHVADVLTGNEAVERAVSELVFNTPVEVIDASDGLGVADAMQEQMALPAAMAGTIWSKPQPMTQAWAVARMARELAGVHWQPTSSALVQPT